MVILLALQQRQAKFLNNVHNKTQLTMILPDPLHVNGPSCQWWCKGSTSSRGQWQIIGLLLHHSTIVAKKLYLTTTTGLYRIETIWNLLSEKEQKLFLFSLWMWYGECNHWFGKVSALKKMVDVKAPAHSVKELLGLRVSWGEIWKACVKLCISVSVWQFRCSPE